MWNLTSFRLEMVLVLGQDKSIICPRCTIGLQIILDALNGTTRCQGSSGSSFWPFGYSAKLDARLVHGLRQMYHRHGNHFRHNRWNPKVMWVMWNLASFRLETVLVSVQDRCMVCARRSIGL